MAKFVVASPHTVEECQKALDETLEQDLLDKFVFGCKAGDHTGWAYIDADSEEEALESVPEFVKDKACAYEVNKFTAADIKAAH